GHNVTLLDTNAVDLGPINIGGNLDVTATNGSITNTGGTLTIGGTASFAANGGGHSILVNHSGNTFASTVTLTGVTLADVSIVDADATLLTLPALTLTGNLNATGTGGIAQGGILSIGGTTTLASGGADINLTNPGNIFTGTLSVASGRDANL